MLNYSRNLEMSIVDGHFNDGSSIILGLEYVSSSYTWRRIDVDSNVVTMTSSEIDSHPIFSNMYAETVDGCAMVRIPRFYFIYQRVSTGHKWWIAPFRFRLGNTLAEPHRAFIYNGEILKYFYLSQYEVSTDPNNSNMVTSAVNKTVLTGKSLTQMKTLCEARNTNGVTGFRMFNIYQLGAIQMLFLFDKANPDSQALCGTGQANTGKVLATGANNNNWRDLHELWGNATHLIEGLENRSTKMYIWPSVSNETFENTNQTIPTISGGGFITDIQEYAANIGLFIASSHSSSATKNMLPDKFWSKGSGNLICSHGGKYSSSTGAGLFNIGVDNVEANAATAAYTTRLSKYDLR